MKRTLLSILSLITFSLAVSAQTTGQCGDSATYVLSADSTLTISGKGAIKESAFKQNADIKKVIVENGISTIGEFAFSECEALESVSLPASVETIESCAFYDSRALSSVSLSEGLKTIEDVAFAFCHSLVTIDLPASLQSMPGYGALNACYKLEAVNIAEGCTAYSSYDGVVFSADKKKLLFCPVAKSGKFAIPAGTESVSESAFSSCSKLTSLEIPASLTAIGGDGTNPGEGFVFDGCSSLTAITADDGNAAYASISGVLFNKDKTGLLLCPGGTSGEYTVPDGVTTINKAAFTGCSKITALTFPSSVTAIGSIMIGHWAFEGSLQKITSYNPAPPACDVSTFSQIDNSIPVYVPASGFEAYKAATGWSAFSDFLELIVASGQCGDNAVYEISADSVLTITGSGTLWDNAFSVENRITKVVIGEGISGFDFAFIYNEKIRSVDIPASATSIHAYAFDDCSSLTDVNVAEGNSAYSSLDGVWLTADGTELILCPEGRRGSYELPASVTKISGSAFYRCIWLTKISLHEDVATIGKNAFKGCVRLECMVSNAATPPAITEALGADSSLPIYVPSANLEAYKSADIWKDLNLIGLTESGKCGYAAEYFLGSDGYLRISGSNAIYEGFFEKRTDIKTVVIEEGITSISDITFSGCASIETVSLPSTLESIGDRAFADCVLNEITSKNPVPPACGTDVFDKTAADIPVTIPSAGFEAYKKAAGWSYFTGLKKLVVMSGPCGTEATYELTDDGSLTVTGSGELWDGCFSGNTAVKSCVIGEGITLLPELAFYECSSLASVTLPESLTDIGLQAFYGCSSLTKLISNASVPPAIATNAFATLDPDMPVYVPRDAIETYKADEGWSYFSTFLAIEDLSSVSAVSEDELIITASNGRIECSAESFTILNLIGQDVTAHNGSLSGIYIVRAGDEVVKVYVR